jgi:hypothetical protein
MTEAEWAACSEPLKLLSFLTERVRSERKRRLFAVACCGRIRHLLTDNGSRAVRAAELFADNLINQRTMHDAWAAIGYPKAAARRYAASAARAASCSPSLDGTAHGAASAVNAAASQAGRRRVSEQTAQTALLRDVFGNPFHPIAADSSWLPSNVILLAQGIYEDRAFDHMPVLADVLEEAGCTEGTILSHCRGAGPHVRGCWVVDLIVGKA